jgi:hypothetical protein
MLIPVEEVAMLMSRCSAVAAMQAGNRGAVLADVVVVSQPFLKVRPPHTKKNPHTHTHTHTHVRLRISSFIAETGWGMHCNSHFLSLTY